MKLSSLPLAVWVPIASGIAVAVPGVIALLTHHPVLFASLGPTSVMIAQQPLLAATKPYNTIAGHMIGLGAEGAAPAGCGHHPSGGARVLPRRLDGHLGGFGRCRCGDGHR